MGGVYTVSMEDDTLMEAYMNGLSESVPQGAPEGDFADPPSGLYVGDAKHARLAVQAVTSGLRGNRAKAAGDPGVKAKIAAAVKKFYSGDEQKYYLNWLSTGKKPAAEMQRLAEIRFTTPSFTPEQEVRFPEVPIFGDVDLDGIRKLDPDPKFVTRPLGILGGISDNNLRYDDAMLNDIYQQVTAKHSPARLGHVSETDRSWRVPPSDGYWVGVLDDPGTVFGTRTIFGKAYIRPNTELREMLIFQELTKTPMSNSVWGLADFTDNSDGTVSGRDMVIESIDFVPPERAALKALGGDFEVTSEMETSMTDQLSEAAAHLKEMSGMAPAELHNVLNEAGRAHEVASEHIRLHESGGSCTAGTLQEMFGKDSRKKFAEMHLREATPEETYNMLSEAQRSHCAECYTKEAGATLKTMQEDAESKKSMAEMSGRVSEMEKSLKDRDARLAEMEKVIKGYQRADFERELEAAIDGYFPAQMNTQKGRDGLANLKKTMRKNTLAEMAGMENGQIETNIKPACDKVWTEDLKALAEMFYASVSGPAAVVNAPMQPSQRFGIDPATGRFSRDALEAARAAGAGATRRKGGS